MGDDRIINRNELVQNDGEDGNHLYVLIEDKVYDLTDFKHPGGKEILMDDIGVDRFEEFDSIHSPGAKQDMVKYLIGNFKEDTVTDKKTDNVQTKKSNGANPLPFVIILLVLGIIAYIKLN